MNEPTMETLARRLDRVERENRWLKGAGVVALAVIAAVVLMGQVTPAGILNKIKTRKIVIADPNGKSKAMLFTSPEGTIFGIQDIESEIRFLVVVGPNGQPLLSLQDKGDLPRAMLTVADGTPQLNLLDKNGKVRAQFEVDGNRPHLILHDGNDKVRVLLTLQRDGSPRLGFMDKRGIPRVALGEAGEEYTMAFFDANGKVRGQLSMDRNGATHLDFYDSNEKIIWSAP